MVFKVTISDYFECSLERAFKTPMLCDVTQVHTGLGLMPKVTHTTEDEDWGQIGSQKKIHVGKSFTQKGGYASRDTVIERVENDYWKIQVDQFQTWMVGFHKLIGVWKTTQINNQKILVEYTYLLHLDQALFYPLSWIFVKLFWKRYMHQVLANVKQMAYNEEPYQYL